MSRLVKNVSVYSLGNILNKSITFLLVPLYTRVLVPSDYGKLEIINTVVAILAMLYGLLVETGYSRVYFQNKDIQWRKSLFFSGQLFNFLCFLFFGGISFFYSEQIARVVFNFENGGIFLKLITIITLFNILSRIPYNNIRNREKSKLFIALNFAHLLLNTLLTILFLVVLRIGVKGILFAQIISGSIQLIALYIATWDQTNFEFSFSGLKAMLGFSVFLLPSNLSSYVLNFSNRFFLSEYMNLGEVGLYSLGAKMAGLIPFLFTEPVKMAFGPHIYNLADNPVKCKQQLADFTRVFFFFLAFVALSLSLFSREGVAILADKSYSGSYSIVFILAISYLVLGLGGIVVTGIQISMKTWIVSLIWPLSAVVNVIANILLIPPYGRYGAALATLASTCFITLSYFVAVHFVYKTNFSYWKMLSCFLLMVMFNYGGQNLNVFSVSISILLKLLLLIIFITVHIVFGYFSRNEIETAKQFIRSNTLKLRPVIDFKKNRKIR